MTNSALEQHVAAVRERESSVQALIDWDENAARQRAAACKDGPLKGWALGVKDIIDVQGAPTRCGVDFLEEVRPASAEVVTRLESLGAYVFSKVVTTKFAYFDPGPTTNPWNTEHTPGGSSSGSAAAVAAGMVRFSLGSQTIGSVGRPAAFCGVVGFKPTYERMPQAGLVPFAPSVDTAGFFTNNVDDLQTVCSAFFDESRVEAPAKLRVGVIEDMLCEPADADMLQAIQEAAAKLSAAGCDVQNAQFPDALREAYPVHQALVRGELAVSHKELFEKHGEQYPPRVRELLLEGQKISPEELSDYQGRQNEFRVALDPLFEDFDVLLTPSAPGAALKGLAITGDPRMNLISTHTGIPALTLPAKLNADRLPLGVQLLTRKMQDGHLLAAGRVVESALGFNARIP